MTENDDQSPPDQGTAFRAIGRGFLKRCPSCGAAPIYAKFLKQVETCPNCAAALGDIRADDFPPYLTIVVVGHIVVPAILMVEKYFSPPTWVHTVTWLPVTLALILWFLPRLKGCAIGLMWHLGLKGDERQGTHEKDGLG
ncbi:MAG: DUF983 domain-containing protein [Rhodospirillaceae bacterium]